MIMLSAMEYLDWMVVAGAVLLVVFASPAMSALRQSART
jgi:hypothetical protein